MKEQNHKRKQTYQIMCLIFGILFVFCLVWLAAYFIGLKKAENEMESILGAYVSEGQPSEETKGAVNAPGNNQGDAESGSGDDVKPQGEETSAEGEQIPEDLSLYGITDRSIDWDALQEEENKDIYAWIVVPGTVIDYPVLQHPEKSDYYLEHNLDGSKGRPGCIYTQLLNSKDWSDRNTVLYGHNMKVGTMFADLHKFEDADFFEENRYIHIYSEDGRILVYEIFAAYVFSDAHILLTYDFTTDAGYLEYLDSIWENTGKRCHFWQDLELGAEDKIITLSTCVRGNNSQRYLVQGVLIAEGEQP